MVEAVTDPEVPPLPPHITAKQARKFLEALWKGDPSRAVILEQSWRQTMEAWLKS